MPTDREKYALGAFVGINKGVLSVDLWSDVIKEIEIGLEHVRAADSIRVRYDFDRDGYVILQSSADPDDWQEVAFVQAWGRNPDA